jgi:hypothetical protein
MQTVANSCKACLCLSIIATAMDSLQIAIYIRKKFLLSKYLDPYLHAGNLLNEKLPNKALKAYP